MLSELIKKKRKALHTGIVRSYSADGLKYVVDLGSGNQVISEAQVENLEIGSKITMAITGGDQKIISAGAINSGEIKKIYING